MVNLLLKKVKYFLMNSVCPECVVFVNLQHCAVMSEACTFTGLSLTRSTVACCTGLEPGSNRPCHVTEVCSGLYHVAVRVCTLDVHTAMKPPNDAFISQNASRNS